MMKKEKKSHGVQLLIRAIVRDPDGKVISDTEQKPAKSFVIQFLEFVAAMFYATGDTPATAIDGGEEYFYAPTLRFEMAFRAIAPVSNSDYGIVIGTGDTAETNEDYKLETQLTQGAGAGNITYGATIIEAVAVVGPNVDLETKRTFTNNTGSTITVKEAGMYTWSFFYNGFPDFQGHHCIIRDVLGAPVDVPDKCSLTVYYTLRTTV